jgi:hypothetical protein
MTADHDALLAEIARPAPDLGQDALFDVEQSWERYWWGMPEFSALDSKPVRQLTVNFATVDDFDEFKRQHGFQVRSDATAAWWPPEKRLQSLEFYWLGDPSPTRYPVYIPSKGRAEVATTPALLQQAGVPFRLVVERTEADAYRAAFGPDCVLELPFADLGQGSIPARNWIWQHAVDNGHPWHWIIDDNVGGFYRLHHNRRLSIKSSSAALRIVEDFADRYDNLAFAGLSDRGFTPESSRSPITINTRVYSTTLINSSLPHRWRGRYNEDTDICLRALKDGWGTALFKSFSMHKAGTARGDGTGGMKGGNTDNVYNTGDYRRRFAESLREQHPDVVEVVWKFNRWHHQVDYSPFRRNELRLRPGVTPIKAQPDYGLRLVRAADIKREPDFLDEFTGEGM